jgi:hypothetical protein
MIKPFLTYLACPYTYPDPDPKVRAKVQADRALAASEATVALIRYFRWNVFSPITHSHPLHEIGLDGDWSFWKQIDTEYLHASVRLVILTIPGWRQSTGVKAEHDIAVGLSIPIHYMTRPTFERRPGKAAFGGEHEVVDVEEMKFRFTDYPDDLVGGRLSIETPKRS